MKSWGNVVGYEGYYEVSRCGQIRSVERTLPLFIGVGGTPRRKTLKSKILAQTNDQGYKRVMLWKNGVGKAFRVHRLVAEVFVEKVLGKPLINHINGIKSDNRSENLEWCTNQENIRHSFAINIVPVRSKITRAKLSEEQATEIINKLKAGVGYKELSVIYNVNHRLVRCIETGRTWKHLQNSST